MSEYEDRTQEQEMGEGAGRSGSGSKDDCETIRDPVRRTLCKACGLPLVGQAPFCRDRELPVP